MQTVPSLVGTGTAIAAAASGLVFGQPTELELPPSRLGTRKIKDPGESGLARNDFRVSSPSSQSGNNTAVSFTGADGSQHFYNTNTVTSSRPPLSRYQRPQSSQVTPPKVTSRVPSFVRQEERPTPAGAEVPRDSFSSGGSWMRRLSIRPISQHGSLRSSFGLDSPSITFSSGSAAPILFPLDPAAPTLPPNKLVKRTSSMQYSEGEPLPRRKSRSHLPTLRRPATSHQRSATLYQFQPDLELASPPTAPKFSFDELRGFSKNEYEQETGAKAAWVSFFHSRTATLNARGTPDRPGTSTQPTRQPASKRICLAANQHHKIHLLQARMVSGYSEPAELPSFRDNVEKELVIPFAEKAEKDASQSADVTPSRGTRRSISMTFSSAGNWVSRTSGSIRRPKRGADPKGGRRNVSAPVSGSHHAANATEGALKGPPMASTPLYEQGSALDSAATGTQLPIRKRNIASPLPPLSRLSTFHVDLSRLESPTGLSHPSRPNQPSGSSTSSTAMSQLKTTVNERPLLRESSEGDAHDFASGDDDDTDFKSDTLFDSIRTGASGRARAVDTPLDSMYDESPPSTAGNGRAKRLSIQEILGKSWDEDNKILEEDESISTTHQLEAIDHTNIRFSVQSSPEGISLSTNDGGRLSMEDEFDRDWTIDDDVPCNPLSPPSKGSSLNSSGMSPNVRLALASISGNGIPEVAGNDGVNERPLSTLFDWSEPTMQDKHDMDGELLRPKTAYAKHEMDSRGGRSAMRRGPTPTHVRSQSVPVVHDALEDAKPTTSKYGTWGMTTKVVSEDWDDDFEFGGGGPANDGKENRNLFAVPESIQATQPSVKAHSGQIREFSLLVNDLKRLCRHGRDLDMLNGPQRRLWKEAEGIIALASPDDEEDYDQDRDSRSSLDSDTHDANNRMLDGESDAASLEVLDAALEGREPTMSKTAVVRERPSTRRRSVFSPEDDIFGGNWPTEAKTPPNRPSRPRTPDSRNIKTHDVNGVVRSMVEAMQLRAVPGPSRGAGSNNNNKSRVHFDTNSLKALVKRAGDLRDMLSDVVRRADQLTQSPARTPRRERHPESSPAFTRVFDDPASSPPRRMHVLPVS